MKIRRIDFYPDDWIAGTVGLTDAERGVYIQVLMGIYARGGPIHIDDAKALCGRQFARSIETLIRRSKLTLTEQQLDSKRAATELQRSTNRALTAQQNGSKGGRPNGLAKPNGSDSGKAINHQSSTNNQQKRSANADSVRAKPPKALATTLPEDWRPDESNRDYARDRGLDPDEMFPEFHNYWCYEKGKNVKRVDWSLTWKERCRTLEKRQGGNGEARSNGHHARDNGVVAAVRELLLEEDKRGLPH